MTQAVTTAALTLMLCFFLKRRGLEGLPLVPATGLVCAWLIASAPAALLANALGLGGRAAASIMLLGAEPRRLIAWRLGAIAGPPLIILALLPGVFHLIFSAPSTGLLAAFAGTGSLLAGAGAGALITTSSPWPARLADPSDPLWTPGAARLLMPLAQGVAFGPSLAALTTPPGELSWVGCSATLLVGLAAAVSGGWLAAARVAQRPEKISEALLG